MHALPFFCKHSIYHPLHTTSKLLDYLATTPVPARHRISPVREPGSETTRQRNKVSLSAPLLSRHLQREYIAYRVLCARRVASRYNFCDTRSIDEYSIVRLVSESRRGIGLFDAERGYLLDLLRYNPLHWPFHLASFTTWICVGLSYPDIPHD